MKDTGKSIPGLTILKDAVLEKPDKSLRDSIQTRIGACFE
jgi:hypothetical protein